MASIAYIKNSIASDGFGQGRTISDSKESGGFPAKPTKGKVAGKKLLSEKQS